MYPNRMCIRPDIITINVFHTTYGRKLWQLRKKQEKIKQRPAIDVHSGVTIREHVHWCVTKPEHVHYSWM